jgi:flagellar hook-basal body complex protein FliE
MSDLSIKAVTQNLSKPNQLVKSKSHQNFGDIIGAAVDNVNKLEAGADQSIGDLLQGKADIHETMIALQKSDISMRTFLAVRNKVIEAYREIMRMQF